MIRVLPISTWNTPCGIAEHTKHLRDALDAHGAVEIGVGMENPDPRHLDPEVFFRDCMVIPDVVWLNYHAALHSRWTPDQVRRLRTAFPVVITYHDTGVPNSLQCKDLFFSIGSSPFIIHEPCDDLPGAIYLRQGIPPWTGAYQYSTQHASRATGFAPVEGVIERPEDLSQMFSLPWGIRPRVGTVGFPFPWKNYDLLCEAAALAGWSVLLLAPNATDAQIQRWRTLNPWTAVVRAFLPAGEVVSCLAGCDVTAFLYMCANTGTSGAIRQGIAARKPVLTFSACRQMRDLFEDSLGRATIRWLDSGALEDVAYALRSLPLQPIDPGIHALAERDSWANQARRYAEIFTAVAQGSP